MQFAYVTFTVHAKLLYFSVVVPLLCKDLYIYIYDWVRVLKETDKHVVIVLKLMTISTIDGA